jgi:hypothetical protein
VTALGDLASRLVVLVAVAFGVWLCLLVLFRRLPAPLAGLLAALLSWGLASVSAAWVVGVLQHHRLWPLV